LSGLSSKKTEKQQKSTGRYAPALPAGEFYAGECRQAEFGTLPGTPCRFNHILTIPSHRFNKAALCSWYD
jgi:hypothetical protein